ncbi:MAG: glycosyltransferase, partial [Pedobacter sp.]
FLYRLIKGMLQFASIRVVLSIVEQQQILNTYGVTCAVIPNAVEAINEREVKDFSGPLSLLFMGRIVKAKGIFLLADSLKGLSKYFSEISLKVYGAGPDLEAFQSELASIPGLNFQYCGIAKGKEKVAALQDAHIFLLPSLYGEGLPIAMLESMNYGCVPIVSDDASIGTVVKDGLNGYLVSKGQIDELQSKLIQVFENRNELAALSENATKTIDTTYNLDTYMKTLNALYTNYNPSN